jgi:hypothetical protein
MAWDYNEIIQSEVDDLQAENAQANALVEAARVRQDYPALREALDRVYEVDKRFASLRARVENMQRQNAPQPGQNYGDLQPHQVQLAHKFGLTVAEMEHALKSTSDPRIDDATRAADYARGKQKRDAWRATGAWDEVDVQKGYRR